MAQQTIDLHVNPSEETIRLGPIAIRFLITAEESGGSVAVFEGAVPGGQRLATPSHSHDHYEETVYVTGAILTFTVDGKEIDIGPGQALYIPRGSIHRFANKGIEEVRAVCIATPGAIGPEYFREAAELINAAAGGQPDRTKMGRSCAATASRQFRLPHSGLGLLSGASPVRGDLRGTLGGTHER